VGGIESDAVWGTWLAYAAIVAFLILLVLVVGRTLVLYGALWLAPLGHLWRRLFGKSPRSP